jgi:hypothetical protein
MQGGATFCRHACRNQAARSLTVARVSLRGILDPSLSRRTAKFFMRPEHGPLSLRLGAMAWRREVMRGSPPGARAGQAGERYAGERATSRNSLSARARPAAASSHGSLLDDTL